MLESAGNQISQSARIWVGDTLIVAVGMTTMNMAAAAVVESIFVVLGNPNLKYRQYLLAIYT